MLEVEIRAVITNPENIKIKLLKSGFKEKPTVDQLDIILDKPDASLFRSGQKIRIRVENENAELTYKGLFQGEQSVSRRTEINVPFDKNRVNDYVTLLTAMGYPICFQIPKTRTLFTDGKTKVTFDIWPIIGCLVELEGQEDAVKQLAKEVAPGIEFKNHRLKDLFQKREQETGQTLADLKKEYRQKTGFDLGNLELLLQ